MGLIKRSSDGSIKKLRTDKEKDRQVILSPEYPGAVLYADGINNSGGTLGMTSDMEKEGDYWYNYYEWKSSETSGLQDYDIIICWALSRDFRAFKSGTNEAIKIDFSTEETATTNNKIDVTVYKDNVLASLGSSLGNTVSVALDWQSARENNSPIAFDGSSLSSLSAGDILIIDIKLYSQNSKYSRVGAITINYTI